MKIDFVITWVDGSDAKWIQKKNEALGKSADNASVEQIAARYRDWGLLKYWFRAVEKYAPWVNKIYVVTDEQKPDFLNLSHPKIKLIYHQEFIPQKYLPTFSSHVIENNMHRIPGLSEHFVYFNDDMYLNRAVEPSDFFRNGKPCYELIERPYNPTFPLQAHNLASVNNMAVINKYFSRKDILKHFGHFVNYRYGKAGLKNLFMLPWKKYSHFAITHLPVPYLKSTIEQVWQCEYSYLDEISYNKIRTKDDVSHSVFQNWDLARGNFSPYHYNGRYISVNNNNLKECAEIIKNENYTMICLNDGGDEQNFIENCRVLQAAFQSKYPLKSKFEENE